MAECCPRFDPKPWNNKKIVWKNKLFARAHVHTLFHIPIDFTPVLLKLMAKIEKSKAAEPRPLVLADESSLFGIELFVSVKKRVSGVRMEKIIGTFLSRVYEGSFREMPNWIKDMKARCGKEPKRMLFYYPTCPKCSKKYGINTVVILAQI